MATELAERPVRAGTVLFCQGDAGDEMYVVARGRIRLTLAEEGRGTDISVLEPGDFFGELSLLSGAPRTATAEVIEDATLLTISRNAFAILMQDDLAVVFRMMNVLGQRLSDADGRLRGEMLRVERIRILVHCLRRCVDDDAAIVTFDLEPFATAVGANGSRVRALVEELVAKGVGALQNGRWTVERGQTNRLVEALAECVAS